jgi:hypothetical protein
LAEAFDGAVGQVVGESASGEAERNGVAAAEPDAFLGEVEADGAYKRAGAEGEHDADLAVRPRPRKSNQRADDQRRCRECPPPQCAGQIFSPRCRRRR